MSRTQRLLVVLVLNLALVAGLVVTGVTAHSLAVLAAGGDYSSGRRRCRRGFAGDPVVRAPCGQRTTAGQTPSTAASSCAWVPVSVSVTTLTWGNPATCPRASFGPPSRRRFAFRLRGVQDEAVHGGEPHPTVEGARQASGGQRPGQLAEDSSRWPVLPGAGEPG